MFRLLRADEIECRVARVNQYGAQLLLYKDARCDQNILDETVGPMNWQRHHSRENANCIVSIWDAEKAQWIEKEDTGTESFTEKEKGLASDSFKRACFNWGIGRELYTAPNIFIGRNQCNIEEKDGRYTCKNQFSCEEIQYKDGKICYVRIAVKLKGDTVTISTFGAPEAEQRKIDTVSNQKIGPERATVLVKLLIEKDVNLEALKRQYNVAELSDLTESQHSDIIRRMNR